MSGVEQAAIDDGESENLARAILDICKRRKVKPNPEALAWGNFAMTLLAIYTPRAIAIMAARQQARQAKKESQAATAAHSADVAHDVSESAVQVVSEQIAAAAPVLN